MGYIPPDAKWYVAELILEFTFQGELENVVHINMILIRADSPEEAFQRAIALGMEEEESYVNPEGTVVTVKFHGLRCLNVIPGELSDGTEIIYECKAGVSPKEISDLVLPKEKLAVFRPIRSCSEGDSE